tara:strand:+ start:615 stop:863 length:249 start_codon:yes stop_codon:yes gene_type:complete
MIDQERELRAQRLLDDPLLNEAFTTLREDLLNRWNASGSTEVEARESIWLAMRLLDRVHSHITSIVESGRMDKILSEQHPFI